MENRSPAAIFRDKLKTIPAADREFLHLIWKIDRNVHTAKRFNLSATKIQCKFRQYRCRKTFKLQVSIIIQNKAKNSALHDIQEAFSSGLHSNVILAADKYLSDRPTCHIDKIRVLRGRSRLALGEVELSLGDLFPNEDYQSEYWFAVALVRLQRLDSAIQVLNSAVSKYPNEHKVKKLRGFVLAVSKNWESAIHDFEACESSYDIILATAACKFLTRDTANALLVVNEGVKTNLTFHVLLLRSFGKCVKRQWDSARADFRLVQQLFPNDFDSVRPYYEALTKKPLVLPMFENEGL